MQELSALLAPNEEWVLHRVLEYAKEHGYSHYAATLVEPWKISISAFTVSMLDTLRAADSILDLKADDRLGDTKIGEFGREEVRRHRARGVTLAMFLGLVKYCRRSYVDLVRQAGLDHACEREYLTFVGAFFDRFEISCAVEWNSLDHGQELEELQTRNRLMTNEKNKYLTIFESLHAPVILLDSTGAIENINQAAAYLFEQYHLAAPRYYDAHPPLQPFPWLARELAAFQDGEEQEVVVDEAVATPLGERHFQVKMKRMLDFSETHRGTVLILEDLTERKAKEEALTLNRATQNWVDRLVSAGRGIAKMDGSGDILALICSAAFELLDSDFVALGLWNRREGLFEVECLHTREGLRRGAGITYRCNPGLADLSPDRLRPILAGLGRRMRRELAGVPSGARGSGLALPLRTDDRLVGALWVGRKEAFAPSAPVVLESLADQAVIVIEHEGLTRRMQSQAVLEERTRIAREMHDGVAQILGFLNLEMQSLEALLRQGRLDDTLIELRRARDRILEAQAEVREDILNLRTALSKDRRAVPALKQHLHEFGAQTGVEVQIVGEVDDDLPLSPLAEVQLVRTVQEALTNVRLHARATRVWATFVAEDGWLAVEVSDNGVGFQQQPGGEHFGFQSMNERIASLGGSLAIESKPGRGTRLRLSIPLEPAPHSLARGLVV